MFSLQPEMIDKLELPCVLKVCRASGCNGTWIVKTTEELNKIQKFISTELPYADAIMQKIVKVN